MPESSIYLPLHRGKAPYWLLGRMKKLALPVVRIIVEEFGEREFFDRMADPIFFQSFSNVLGFDWNSSGSTTVLMGVLKSVLNSSQSNVDIRVAGGKGKEGIKTPEHIVKFAEELGIPDINIRKLINASRFAAKTDSSVLQDSYDIYHHCIIFSRKHFLVIQQGMNSATKMARRYHWKPDFEICCEKQHYGIAAERREREVLDLTSRRSRENRETALDIIRDNTFKKDYRRLLSIIRYRESVSVPRRINWKAVETAYNLQPSRFEELLFIKGIGKGTIRALALISDLIYNREYSRQDPAKYCFAVGGKDGVPFPVNRQSYDEVIEFMRDIIKQSELGDFEKLELLRKIGSLW
jgi:hypothetical protein